MQTTTPPATTAGVARPGTIAIVVLAFNEEANIEQALSSVVSWADEVFVLDSFSTDRTVELARARGAHVLQHRFENYGAQRNAALDLLPITSEWIFFLDADEYLPEALKAELREVAASGCEENGFYVRWRLMWMGAWVRRGYYGTQLMRFFRYGKGRCETREVNEHMRVEGKTGMLANDFIHQDLKPLDRWIHRHVGYAKREAKEVLRKQSDMLAQQIPSSLFGSRASRVRWVRHHVWDRLPPLVRPFLYFSWRLFLRGGVLDGKRAFTYHFLQGLWFPMLTDTYYLELKRKTRP